MQCRRMRLLCFLALPFLAFSARADSVRGFGSAARAAGTIHVADSAGLQAPGDLTTAGSSPVLFNNGDQANQVFWQLRDSAALGITPASASDILASITMSSPAQTKCRGVPVWRGASGSSGGCATETITLVAVPEPSTFFLLAVGLIGALHMRQVMSRRW